MFYLHGGGGGVGVASVLKIAVQQNRTDDEANVEAAFPGLKRNDAALKYKFAL